MDSWNVFAIRLNDVSRLWFLRLLCSVFVLWRARGTNGRDEEDRRRQKTTNRGNENSLVGSCLLFPVLAIVVDRFIHLAVCLSFGSNQTNTGQVMVQPLLVVAKLLLNGSLMGDN
jgi:hypothetical protein